MYQKILLTAATALLLSSTAPAFAAAPHEPIDIATEAQDPAMALAEAMTPEIGYYDMTPDFTTNLANSGGGRLHYLRVHVNVMVKDSRDLPLVTEHDALIRDAIITIIGAKEYNAIATAAGREALRAECRARVAELLASKKNGPVIQDLLFTNYIYQ
ncbi:MULTISPECIES: flagellar basal body-associated FliL family protein [unclassified Anaerobiospirillum]|uniref:flagellar basal body-associated FliL family protein n=1 Tax=unclassified Anaerobiospirillum TaxID=2647410 RepID=UPI001FF5E9F3|nr:MULTISPECIES: flagellar basal body-associated FliL family protein [unclassified Anaerobiospirillum]MCK0526932.1 flagellar basal body-associated FliL family protein [Anaerobiospirillum sp. NML120449]MCK0535618.1 flagellar basal body-associated FliL family protein [Anaerobiospirillum sp. NML120511]MCK0540784.1 flagellar basal body-associated FliL family protein [Anaerobiospirillum sp. NML02-A-032]